MFLFSYLVASSLLAGTLAGPVGSSSIIKSEVCTTALATTKPKHTPIKTVTVVHHDKPETLTRIVQQMPIKTVRAPRITHTITNTDLTTTTVVTTPTDTVITVLTSTSLTTTTTTNVNVITESTDTISTSTSTSHVPTSSGFIDVYTSSGDETCGGDVTCATEQKKRQPLQARAQPTSGGKSNGFLHHKHYPQSVKCVNHIKTVHYVTVTRTAKTQTTTVTPRPITKTTSTLSTTTQTSAAAEQFTTITQNTVSTSTVVSTVNTDSTTTSTNTIVQLTSTTVYDACATNNLLGPAITPNGEVIDEIFGSINNYLPADSEYDCCVLCATDATCQYASYESTQGYCYYNDGDTSVCPAGASATFVHSPASQAQFSGTVFNGACGTWTDGGEQ